ncbi:MAG TPA: M23 family metallopeptidase [Oculatellaceae cyanobacterium]|jgi:murein DD-endopeptidase MepM/ murein hydrolase activator NlpD
MTCLIDEFFMRRDSNTPFGSLLLSRVKTGILTLALALFAIGLPINTEALPHYYAPVDGKITSHFGWRSDPFTSASKFHGGIDIAAPEGTTVYALQGAIVTFSGVYGGYGNVVVLHHGNSLYTLYGHNSRLLVSPGQTVYPGQPIALVGSTGRATGPHLHFEVHYRQQYVNPSLYLAYLQQQNPMLSTIRRPVSPDSGPPPVPKASHKPQDTPKIAKKPAPRKAYHATVQVVNGTQIRNLRF